MSRFAWSDEQVATLLACETDDDLRAAFPDKTIKNLRRRQQEFKKNLHIAVSREAEPRELISRDRKIARLEEEVRLLRRNYKAQTRETAGMDALVEAIYSVVPEMPKAIVPPKYKPKGKEIEDESAVLCLGDWHYGQVVDPEQNGGISAYNVVIARDRIRFTIDTAIKLATEKLQGYRFNNLYVFGLGDWVSGIIHKELEITNEIVIVEQILEVSNLLAEALLKLAMVFPHVHFVNVVGNHGRVEAKPYWDNKAINNYDYLVGKIVERQLAKQPNITFNLPKSFWALQEVENTRFLVTHGDSVKGWGGIPFYGLQRLYTKMRTLQQDYGADFHHIVCGHLHNPNEFTIVRHKMFINGALVGGDPFSIGAISAACDPVQLFFGVHPRRGITWRFPITSLDIN